MGSPCGSVVAAATSMPSGVNWQVLVLIWKATGGTLYGITWIVTVPVSHNPVVSHTLMHNTCVPIQLKFGTNWKQLSLVKVSVTLSAEQEVLPITNGTLCTSKM